MGGPGATRSRDTSHHLRMMEVRHKPARPSYGLSFWRLYNPRASSALHAVCAQGFPRPRPPVQSAVEYVVGVYAAALGRAELRRIRLGYSPTALLVLVPLRPFPHDTSPHRAPDDGSLVSMSTIAFSPLRPPCQLLCLPSCPAVYEYRTTRNPLLHCVRERIRLTARPRACTPHCFFRRTACCWANGYVGPQTARPLPCLDQPSLRTWRTPCFHWAAARSGFHFARPAGPSRARSRPCAHRPGGKACGRAVAQGMSLTVPLRFGSGASAGAVRSSVTTTCVNGGTFL